MNRFAFVFIVALLALNCETQRPANTGKTGESDSLAIALADSLRRADPWLKYSFVERQGKRLFDRYCAVCHGANGEGDGFNSYNLDPRPHSLTDSAYVAALSDATLAQVIALGGRGVNKSVLMPAYGQTLDGDQISYLVAYIRTFVQSENTAVE